LYNKFIFSLPVRRSSQNAETKPAEWRHEDFRMAAEEIKGISAIHLVHLSQLPWHIFLFRKGSESVTYWFNHRDKFSPPCHWCMIRKIQSIWVTVGELSRSQIPEIKRPANLFFPNWCTIRKIPSTLLACESVRKWRMKLKPNRTIQNCNAL